MKLLYLIVALLGVATAQFNFDNWHAALPSDSRGPCPGLNSLANHAFLPHNGKNITLPVLVKALSAVNVSTELATQLAMTALTTSSNPASGAFELNDLKNHKILEHDGSLSRKDTALSVGEVGSQNQAFDWSTFNQYLGYFNGSTQITIPTAAKARWGRIQTSRRQNPSFSYSPSDRFNSYAETTIFFDILEDATTGTVPIDRIKIFFSEERFPYKEGWRPVNPISGISSASTILKLALNTPEDDSDIVMRSTK